VLVDMGPRATGKEAVATVVVDKMRRRMRQNGYHAHITLQVCQSVLGKHQLLASCSDSHLMACLFDFPMTVCRGHGCLPRQFLSFLASDST